MFGALIGGDSEVPQPSLYRGHDVWLAYVGGPGTAHVWSREDVKATGDRGIRGILPMVVPAQDVVWWQNYEALHALVHTAQIWGVIKGSPLCIDIEEAQAEAMARAGRAADIAHAWHVICRAEGYRPWSYGGRSWHLTEKWNNKFLAEYPMPVPANPKIPRGFNAWQYAGNVQGKIDEDLFGRRHTYLRPCLTKLWTPVV